MLLDQTQHRVKLLEAEVAEQRAMALEQVLSSPSCLPAEVREQTERHVKKMEEAEEEVRREDPRERAEGKGS
eukprot:746133-Hanusia_phi.AAC.1